MDDPDVARKRNVPIFLATFVIHKSLRVRLDTIVRRMKRRLLNFWKCVVPRVMMRARSPMIANLFGTTLQKRRAGCQRIRLGESSRAAYNFRALEPRLLVSVDHRERPLVPGQPVRRLLRPEERIVRGRRRFSVLARISFRLS